MCTSVSICIHVFVGRTFEPKSFEAYKTNRAHIEVYATTAADADASSSFELCVYAY